MIPGAPNGGAEQQVVPQQTDQTPMDFDMQGVTVDPVSSLILIISFLD